MVASRVGDGRNAQVAYTKAPAPGVWQPPATGMALPWLGFVKPLVLPNPVTVDGPDPIDSAAYATDFNEVKSLGSATSKKRTAAQTETAKFYSATLCCSFARPYCNTWTAIHCHWHGPPGCSPRSMPPPPMRLIQAWRLKYDIGFWRPFQAIPAADTDGNDATDADAKWVPLLQPATPPYPDYVSGHAASSRAFTATVGPVLGDGVSLKINSAATKTRSHLPEPVGNREGCLAGPDLARDPLPRRHGRRLPARSPHRRTSQERTG